MSWVTVFLYLLFRYFAVSLPTRTAEASTISSSFLPTISHSYKNLCASAPILQLATIYLKGDPFPGVHPNGPPVPGANPTGFLTGVVGIGADAPVPVMDSIGGVSVL
jgi:hypothetical protein